MEIRSAPESNNYVQYRADIMTRVLSGKTSWEDMTKELDAKVAAKELDLAQQVEILNSIIWNRNRQ